ncbi:MAG: aldo/keto reductase [Hyphomonadaceae bacterium]
MPSPSQLAVPRLALNDGHAIPQFGLGVWQVPLEDTAKVVSAAFDCGYRMIDTAAAYRNEQGVGDAIKASGLKRDDLYIITKLWNGEQGHDSTLKAFDASMAKLGLDYLDLYLIHWPAPRLGKFVDSWKAMIKLQADKRIRSIGVSNFYTSHLQRLLDETGVTPAANQVPLYPGYQQRELRALHARLGIVTQSWSPLGQGRYLDNPAIAAIARKHAKTPAQVILRWHLESGLVVIPKSVTPARIQENAGALGFTLDADDMAAIATLDRADGRLGPDPDAFTVPGA